MTIIVLEPPADLINANHRLHYQAKAKLTKAWREAAEKAIDGLGCHRPIYDSAHIVIGYRFPTNHRREVANLQPTSKALVDGLVDAGVIPDDSDDYVTGPDNRRVRPNGPLQVTITITEGY
jgi:crossover junction endodeoxyribonuclease RusA